MTTAEKAPLTARQKEAYDFITSHMELYSPTVREIARAMSIKSPNGVIVHLDALEKKGWITRRPNSTRGIEVTP
jgi:repressor LexA